MEQKITWKKDKKEINPKREVNSNIHIKVGDVKPKQKIPPVDNPSTFIKVSPSSSFIEAYQ